ncbi:MAG: UDP-3-O-(3-hydroxymyristoyl)glucosamine N-acyltransferase [Pseudomonadota bacterium]
MRRRQVELSLQMLAAILDLRYEGDPERPVTGIAALKDAGPGDLSHYSSRSYLEALGATAAAVVILRPQDRALRDGPVLLSDNPYLAYARASQHFSEQSAPDPGVHPSAVVAARAEVDSAASVGALAVIGERATVAAGAVIGAGACIGDDCAVGPHSRIQPRAVLDSDVHVGARCIVHSGAVVGAEGFGYTPDERGQWQAIAQLGGVRIGDDVSIGAGTCIDRGALGDTRIGDGVKIDNLCQIGHNCDIGDHSLICGCVGIVGSTTIGRHCVLAGGCGIGGDQPVTLCDQVVVSAMTLISQSIAKPGVYSGATLHAPHGEWKRNALRARQLDTMHQRLRKLERE